MRSSANSSRSLKKKSLPRPMANFFRILSKFED